MKELTTELYYFTMKNAQSALFGGYLLFFIIFASYIKPQFISVYDFIFISAVLFQLIFLIFKFESKKEFFVIITFHIVATVMEIFKTYPSIGSWSYPQLDSAYFTFMTVPLFTGFLYSAVGSYISRSFRFLNLKYINFPNYYHLWIVSVLIYVNFFTHHFFYDLRYILFVYIFLIFYKTNIEFKVYKKVRKLNFIVAGFLTAVFVWIAENIASFKNIWLYPDQIEYWKMVSFTKMGSWFLLLILSFALVSLIYKERIYTSNK